MADQAFPADRTQTVASRARQDRVNEVWSAESLRDAEVIGRYWLAHPMVQARVNTLASGRKEVDAYGRLAEVLARRGVRLPIESAISLGCGLGGLERDLVGRGLVRNIIGLDLAEGAIAEARRLAAASGLRGISYQVADLEGANLTPGSADVVFAHQSVHHIEALDALLVAVRRALRPGGTFHLHEFVGPIRFQWTDSQLALVNDFLDSLPARLRRTRTGEPKPHMARPTIAAMIAADPSEAIRSAEIPTALRRHFNIVEERRLGGTLLHLALGDIVPNFDPGDPEARAALEDLFAAEDAAMADGRIGSDFVVLTAVPRRLTPGYLAARLMRRAAAAFAARPAPPEPAAEPPDPAFDEQFYLDTYPDVREAVRVGQFGSGYEHWQRFGRAEGRQPSINPR